MADSQRRPGTPQTKLGRWWPACRPVISFLETRPSCDTIAELVPLFRHSHRKFFHRELRPEKLFNERFSASSIGSLFSSGWQWLALKSHMAGPPSASVRTSSQKKSDHSVNRSALVNRPSACKNSPSPKTQKRRTGDSGPQSEADPKTTQKIPRTTLAVMHFILAPYHLVRPLACLLMSHFVSGAHAALMRTSLVG